MKLYFLVKDSLEGGYEAKAIGNSIFTQAETYEELKINIKDAVACHFEDSELPKMIRIHYDKEEIIAA